MIYTQLVQIAIHIYFFFALFGNQFLHPTSYIATSSGGWTRVDEGTPGATNLVGYTEAVTDMQVPWFTILMFIFYFGWLHVSQVLINPMGEDDEDFDMNELLNRHLQISYRMVDGEESEEEEDADPYCGSIPSELPHTVQSIKIRKKVSFIFPTDNLMNERQKVETQTHLRERRTGIIV